jgi:hypothetical protein
MSSQTTSKPVKTHLPCPCGKSSDAFTVFSDGHGYCFSGICSSPYFSEVTYEGHKGLPIINIPATTSAPQSYTTEYLPLRGLTKETLQKFNILTRVDESGKPYAIEFPMAIRSRYAR